MTQFGYYMVIILLGLGNLGLAAVAYRQRDKQIRGNALRETQVELAELRNEMAQRRMEYLRMQIELLREIRDTVKGSDGDAPASSGATPRQPAEMFRRSRGRRDAPARRGREGLRRAV